MYILFYVVTVLCAHVWVKNCTAEALLKHWLNRTPPIVNVISCYGIKSGAFHERNCMSLRRVISLMTSRGRPLGR